MRLNWLGRATMNNAARSLGQHYAAAWMEPPSPGLLMQELERQGIVVGQSFICPRLAALTGFVGDLVGVGRVAEAM